MTTIENLTKDSLKEQVLDFFSRHDYRVFDLPAYGIIIDNPYGAPGYNEDMPDEEQIDCTFIYFEDGIYISLTGSEITWDEVLSQMIAFISSTDELAPSTIDDEVFEEYFSSLPFSYINQY